jgi:hypothetical protein
VYIFLPGNTRYFLQVNVVMAMTFLFLLIALSMNQGLHRGLYIGRRFEVVRIIWREC